MAQKKKSYRGKKQYGVYESQGKYAKNKRAKLERHLKKYPNDAQAKRALGSINAYSRKKSQIKGHYPPAKSYVFDEKWSQRLEWVSPAGVDVDVKKSKRT